MSIPIEYAIAADFIPLRAALVRTLGSSEAIVWQLIYFRTTPDSPAAYEQDGHRWWRANRDELAQSSGLTPDQIKRVIGKLEKSGDLEGVEHRADGYTDRTKSYRCVTDESARSTGAIPPSRRAGDSAQSSSKKEKKGVSTSYSPDADGIALSDLFEQGWQRWPKKHSKKPAWEKFQRLVKAKTIPAEVLVRSIAQHGDAYAATTPTQFVPALVAWLNQERWTDPLAQPRGGRGQERQDEGLALIARLQEEERRAAIGSGDAAAVGAGSGWADPQRAVGQGVA